ncbi:DUF1203 domain-containing protein [Stackebrandtia nassauensis]|uniref:DUF1203 domain-containing protein n=1 Tax=Stackebrandtia nassauensis (strain DSM 44728 / CIP 108903 / NRRL B-16338 / NBRC 102104 / LLR-40K-21) TaxID=446470 RepID=D3PYA1_STANL|nr:DUF1203 domain-containing protein [Stackebrandtia nassauensis]ADD41468.1 protein of unknown function DUF1203 [Stackebrandtia nassauensis DSM 44728]
MTSTYTIAAIAPHILERLRELDDAGNPPEEHVDPEQPLRCCLRRSRDGERLFLVSYSPLRHWAAETGAKPGPYLEFGPVFIHAEDCGGPAEPGVPTGMLGQRRVCRAYNAEGRIIGGVYVEDDNPTVTSIEDTLAKQFADPATALVHVRAVEYGCFLYEVRRA